MSDAFAMAGVILLFISTIAFGIAGTVYGPTEALAAAAVFAALAGLCGLVSRYLDPARRDRNGKGRSR